MLEAVNHPADPSEDAEDAGLREAWALCYIDPKRSEEAGQRLTERGGVLAAWGWWHMALSVVRLGHLEAGASALARAREGFGHQADARTALALCDVVEAIGLRMAGDAAGALRLHEHTESLRDVPLTAMHRFIAHNARAIAHMLLGQMDEALRHFLIAYDAAQESGNLGARIGASANLGGCHQDLHNLEDARTTSETALQVAKEAGSPAGAAVAANNLVLIYYALGEMALARATAGFMQDPASQLGEATKPFRTAIALGHLAVGELDAAEVLLAQGPSSGPGDTDGRLAWAWVRMRCALARADAASARALGEQVLAERQTQGLADVPFDMMQLHNALADACEALGDARAALAGLRRAHELYTQLVGRSARARRIALEVGFELARTKRERDAAVEKQRVVEAERRRLSKLNAALQAQVRANEELQHRLREQALHDALTGLHNRRYLFETVPGLLELTRRRQGRLCVALLDLDHFKQLNDRFGHQAGDRVLQAFAKRGRGMLRRSDLFSRYGGEEFVAVMPDIDAEGAFRVLGRLLEACLERPLASDDPPMQAVTFSAGIALFPQHADSLEQLLQRADLALYAAKGLGRARIEIAPLGSGQGAPN